MKYRLSYLSALFLALALAGCGHRADLAPVESWDGGQARPMTVAAPMPPPPPHAPPPVLAAKPHPDMVKATPLPAPPPPHPIVVAAPPAPATSSPHETHVAAAPPPKPLSDDGVGLSVPPPKPPKPAAPRTAETPKPVATSEPPVAAAEPMPPATGRAPPPERKTPVEPAAAPVTVAPQANQAAGAAARLFMWPVQGKILEGYGAAINGTHNDGINIAAPAGTPVRAAATGTVAYAGNELRGYGNLVLIKHEGGYLTAYAHNAKLLVHRGDRVVRGQVIAKVGTTGTVGEPQLHFEIRYGHSAIDPAPLLPEGPPPEASAKG